MNINEKFNELLDGSISIQDEESLFSVLGKSAEARGDFKQSLAVEFGIQRDALDIAPSREATNKIFSELNIESLAHNPVGKAVPLLSLLSLRLKMFATAIVSSAVTAFLMFNFSGSEKDTINQFASHEHLNHTEPISLIIELPSEIKYVNSNSTINSTNSNSSTPSQEESQEEPQENSSHQPIASNDIDEQNHMPGATSNNSNHIINFSSIAKNNISFTRLLFSTNYRKENGLYELDRFPGEYKALGEYIDKVTIRINKYSDNLYISGYSVAPKTESYYDNISFSVIYNYSMETRLGLEIRQENFFKETFRDLASGDVTFQQQSSVTAGLLLNRDLYKFNNFARTYIDFWLGGNPAILMFRTGAGIELRLFQNFFLSTGFQLSQFKFTDNEDKDFWGSKTSFYGGINYDL